MANKSYIISLLRLKCNRCREGDLFQSKSSYGKGFMKMHDKCPVYSYPTEIEANFYYGTGYVSYALRDIAGKNVTGTDVQTPS